MPLSDLSALELFHRTIVKTVREDSPDLSARQMALLLTVYLTEPPHTVRGMAKLLNVSKPAITRALDRLTSLKLIRRKKTMTTGATFSFNARSGGRYFYVNTAR